MRYFFPLHYDAGNRGCEGIAKGSASLLTEPASNLFAYSKDVQLDTRMGIQKCMQLIPFDKGNMVFDKCLGVIHRLLNTEHTFRMRWLNPYRKFLKLIEAEKGDVVLFTGGDMMCYDDNEIIALNDLLHRGGVRTVLWGCSMGEENLTRLKRKTLENFSLIYARESLSQKFFLSLGLKNVCLYPDPAFSLAPEPCTLPTCFQTEERKKVIGLNLSNFIMGGMTLDGKFAQEVILLINHILQDTDYHILLIPHVTWNRDNDNQDDRQMASMIYKQFGNSDRMSIMNVDDKNYLQIRYVISHCNLFIGARTHAVISAYSTYVPTLALGYSIKSRGIALDLGLNDRLIVNCKQFNQGDLCRSFDYLLSEKDAISINLKKRMPDYCKSALRIKEELKNLSL